MQVIEIIRFYAEPEYADTIRPFRLLKRLKTKFYDKSDYFNYSIVNFLVDIFTIHRRNRNQTRIRNRNRNHPMKNKKCFSLLFVCFITIKSTTLTGSAIQLTFCTLCNECCLCIASKQTMQLNQNILFFVLNNKIQNYSAIWLQDLSVNE